MLRIDQLLDRDGVAVADVACRIPVGRGHTDQAAHHSVVFVRTGSFVRRADGTSQVLDPTRIYWINPGSEQRYDHAHADGDVCTSMRFDPTLVASMWGGDPRLPSDPVSSTPSIDLEHRLLLAAARGGACEDQIFERTITLAARALAEAHPGRVASGRPATARHRKALVDGAREALAADPACSLPDLASALGVSVHHLSRTFHAAVGHTIARHRMRLRARAALERLASGDQSLARLAAELGFSDQSHLSRVLRAETELTPGQLRRAFASLDE